jgi:hypothetical protein
LVRQLRESLIFPLLRAETREAFFSTLNNGLHAYVTLTEALRELLRDSPAPPPPDEFWEDCCEDVRTRLGEAESDELRFDLDTFRRTRRLLGRLNAVEAADKTRDVEFHETFILQAAMHTIGVVAILAACDGTSYTETGLQSSFELARGGALRAYAAARSAITLRARPIPLEQGEAHFDREDAYLAGITGHA